MKTMTLDQAAFLPRWRGPIGLLFLMAFGMPLAFATWQALLNNFVIEVAGFNGADIGTLHSIREIPGFLAVGVLVVLLFMREQVLGLVSMLLLGVATAVTAWFPTYGGIMLVTLFSSIGFHYYETVNQSLQLQWLPKKDAPRVLGLLLSAGSAATLLSYGGIVLFWTSFNLSFNTVYMVTGGATALVAIIALFAYPQFSAPHPQEKKMVLRKRYWLYYALQFLAGARRQIFVVFAGFMMVEHFGFKVHEITAIYMINLLINIVAAPAIGRLVGRYGERRALLIEYAGLIAIFLAYGGIYWFGWGVGVAVALYILDHMFFALKLALKTYFQKIADPKDIAPTAAVAFTINHIAAVGLPVALGLLWLVSPAMVFVLAALLAGGSFLLALLIPRHPEEGYETILSRPRSSAAPAGPDTL